MREISQAWMLLPFPFPLSAQNRPSFRGRGAEGTGEGKRLPAWNMEKCENVLWGTPIPGFAHSSPVVWENRNFVTTAIASDQNRAMQIGQVNPLGLSNDRLKQSWRVYCLNRSTGRNMLSDTGSFGRYDKCAYVDSVDWHRRKIA
jgi:hypothetical protein